MSVVMLPGSIILVFK